MQLSSRGDDYQICTKCIMDTTDPEISFDQNGVCNHCLHYQRQVKERIFTGETGQQKLNRIVNQIKTAGKNKKYDCIIGVSGGVDSTFAAYTAKRLGLRPLAVHLDNGWNSEIASHNMEKTMDKLGIDLYIHKVDWNEFKDLQLAFLKASVPDAEMPTDHALPAFLYQFAIQHGVRFIITGVNVATEGHLPMNWSYGHSDWKYIKSIHRRFGNVQQVNYPHYSPLTRLYYIFLKRIRIIRILDYDNYVKKDTMEILKRELGWEYYGGKHYESIYTRFLQAYILPRKFNIDKRLSHLSTLICAGEITRAEALEELSHKPYPTEEMERNDKEYVLQKLGLTEEEFERIMSLPKRTFRDFPSNNWLFVMVSKLAWKLPILRN